MLLMYLIFDISLSSSSMSSSKIGAGKGMEKRWWNLGVEARLRKWLKYHPPYGQNQLPSFLCAKSPTDIGYTQRVTPIKIQINPLKPLPIFNQYPIRKESLQGKMLIIEDFRAPGLIISCFRPSNLPILLVRKPKGPRMQVWPGHLSSKHHCYPLRACCS